MSQIPTVSIDAVPDPLPEELSVLDVREPEEWAHGHIEGAVHIPLMDLPQRLPDVPNGHVVVVCKIGGRSARAGWIRWKDELPTTPPRPGGKNPLAARVVLDDQSGLDITEAGTRKSLAAYVVRDPQDVPGIASLGPDPLTDDFTIDRLRQILEQEGRKQLKGVLRHQGTIAGIGNAYSDEILHAAKMSPFKPANGLTDDELATLYAAVRDTLGAAVERSRGLAASELKGEKKSHLAVHAQTGKPCPVCGDIVREVSFADSSLQYCPTCQTGGKPLADRRMSRLLK